MQNTFATSDEHYDDTLEQIRLEFIEQHEAGQAPTLDGFVARYPRYAGVLTDFVLNYLRTENALARQPVVEEASPSAVAAVNRALTSLGIAPVTQVAPNVQRLSEIRNQQRLSLGELARRLLLPTGAVLKLERGQIVAWPTRLSEKLADVLAVPREQAEAILQATAGNFRTTAAAFSAEGDPEIKQVNERRQETYDFADALSKERLTPEQASFWKAE